MDSSNISSPYRNLSCRLGRGQPDSEAFAISLQVVGGSHHNCPLEFRERLAVADRQLPDVLAQFQNRFPNLETVLLSTCNRTEIYTAAERSSLHPSATEIARFIAQVKRIDDGQMATRLFRRTGPDAIRHLFSVAASLDSMVVGEDQILTQVKRAYSVASRENSAGIWTHAVFQAAIAAARRVASGTAIHARRVSIPSVAIGEFAKQVLERFDDKSILVIGAGEMSRESIRYLASEGAQRIYIVNRHDERAATLAEQCGGMPCAWKDLDELLVQADLVVSATGSQTPIVNLPRFQKLATGRFRRPLFILDLALPRDFEPQIADCHGVSLYTLDDLRHTCQLNLQARKLELPRAREIIEEEAERFMTAATHQNTGPTIRQLKQSAESIRQAELDRLFRKLDHLDERSRNEIEQSFQRMINKILHPPLESLREHSSRQDQAHLLDALRRLFRLTE